MDLPAPPVGQPLIVPWSTEVMKPRFHREYWYSLIYRRVPYMQIA